MISYKPPLLHGGVHGDQEQKYFFSDCDAVMKPRGRPCNKVALCKKKKNTPGSLQRTFRTSSEAEIQGGKNQSLRISTSSKVMHLRSLPCLMITGTNRGARGTNDLRPLSVVLSWSSFRRPQASNSTDTESRVCAPEFKLWAAIYILYTKIE